MTSLRPLAGRTVGKRTKINVYMLVSLIKTVMYTKYQNTIFDQNGIFIKMDKSYLYNLEFIPLKIETLHIY